MKVAIFSSKPYDQSHLERANQQRHELVYFEAHLNEQTRAT